MQKYFNQFKDSLLEFIDQRDFLIKVVATPPAEAALMLKLLLDHQNASSNDLFYLFPHEFVTAESYVDAVCMRICHEYESSLDLDSDQYVALPSPPKECLPSSTLAPSTRLKACFQYGRDLIEPSTGHRIVWGFSPESIGSLDAYISLWNDCLPTPNIQHWMRGSRLFVRVPAEIDDNSPILAKSRVQFERFIIPENASEMELKEDVSNPGLPMADRMRSQIQLAFIDLAHGRLQIARVALMANLAFYQQQKELGMQAMTMIGLGDICRRENDLQKAKYWYQCAIKPAGEGRQLICLDMCANHLGTIAFEQENYVDAEFYFDQLTILKRYIPDESGLVDALLWRARSQLKLGNFESATSSCQESLLLCKTFDLGHKEQVCLAELRRVLTMRGTPVEAEFVCKEWESTDSLSGV